MSHAAKAPDIQHIEVELLLEALHLRYGYDFRDYARETVVRRLEQCCDDMGIPTISELTGKLLRDPSTFYRVIGYFSVNVTALFRDPHFYTALRDHVLPMLRTWPHMKIWDAGCATGEELYSLAILLVEGGLSSRARIYATDLSAAALDTARAGIYPLEILAQGGRNYFEFGGSYSLANYYLAGREAGVMDARLRHNITFARHNLAMDKSFGEMQAVICRNVLIYFNRELQDAVLQMFWESLDHGGYLCLGNNESISFTSVEKRFDVVDAQARIYRKRVLR
jgi:chemotaxis protein methyltransferase CheR